MNPKRVLVVEDDGEQRADVTSAIIAVFPAAEIVEFSTGGRVQEAVLSDNVPYCELAVVDRLLIWHTVDQVLANPEVVSNVPPAGKGGEFVARSLATIPSPPKLIVYLTILGDDPEAHTLGVRTAYVRKDATLDDFTAFLHRVKDGSYDD